MPCKSILSARHHQGFSLKLSIGRVEVNHFVQFPRVDAMLREKKGIQMLVLEHLLRLLDEFQRYFPERRWECQRMSYLYSGTNSQQMSTVFHSICRRNSWNSEIIWRLKIVYQRSTMAKIWANIIGNYPNLLPYSVRCLLSFPSATYMCEWILMSVAH